MAKPVVGYLGYDEANDRPTVKLTNGTRRLLTQDDATGGSVTEVDSPDGSIVVTNGTGPTVSVEANFGTGAGEVMEGNQAAGGDATGTLDNLTIPHLSFLDSEFWVPPASPSADDEEFTGGSLPSGWQLCDATNAAAATALGAPLTIFGATFNTSGAVRADYNVRRSWARVQPTNAAERFALSKALTPTSDAVFRGRVSVDLARGATGTFAGIMLATDNGGFPNLTTTSLGANGYVFFGFNAQNLIVQHRQAGATNNAASVTVGLQEWFRDQELILLKNGTTYAALVRTATATWYPAATFSFTPTVAHVGFMFTGNTGGGINNCHSVDYFRYQANTFNPLV